MQNDKVGMAVGRADGNVIPTKVIFLKLRFEPLR